MAETKALWIPGLLPASTVVDIRPLIARWDMFYNAAYGNLDGVHRVFNERFTHEGYTLPIQSFIYRNKIATIVEKRAEAIPSEFAFEVSPDLPGAEDLAAWVESWLYGTWFGEGMNIWQVLGSWHLMLERHGNVILKLSSEPDAETGDAKVYVSRMDPSTAEKFVSPEDVTQVIAWRFTWTNEVAAVAGGTQMVEIEEWYDAQVFRRKIDGEIVREDEHGLGFVPVVHVKVGAPDALWGVSVIEHLIEPQLQLALAQSTLRMSNRWRGWPAFAGTAPVTEINLRPGGYTAVEAPNSLWALTWSTESGPMEKERDDYLDDLYERGRVARKSRETIQATGALPSGKALIVLTQDFVTYLRGAVSILEESMAELIHKALVMSNRLDSYGKAIPPVRVTYGALRLQDQDEKIARGKLLIEAFARGVIPQRRLLEAFIGMDLIDADVHVDTLIEELSEEKERGLGAHAAVGGFGLGPGGETA